jgi:hypothetical protein
VNSRPVTYRDSSEARNSTTLLTSRGSVRYLRVKRDRMGHDLPGLPWYDDDVSWASLATRHGPRPPAGDEPDARQLYGLYPGLEEQP